MLHDLNAFLLWLPASLYAQECRRDGAVVIFEHIFCFVYVISLLYTLQFVTADQEAWGRYAIQELFRRGLTRLRILQLALTCKIANHGIMKSHFEKLPENIYVAVIQHQGTYFLIEFIIRGEAILVYPEFPEQCLGENISASTTVRGLSVGTNPQSFIPVTLRASVNTSEHLLYGKSSNVPYFYYMIRRRWSVYYRPRATVRIMKAIESEEAQ